MNKKHIANFIVKNKFITLKMIYWGQIYYQMVKIGFLVRVDLRVQILYFNGQRFFKIIKNILRRWKFVFQTSKWLSVIGQREDSDF